MTYSSSGRGGRSTSKRRSLGVPNSLATIAKNVKYDINGILEDFELQENSTEFVTSVLGCREPVVFIFRETNSPYLQFVWGLSSFNTLKKVKYRNKRIGFMNDRTIHGHPTPIVVDGDATASAAGDKRGKWFKWKKMSNVCTSLMSLASFFEANETNKEKLYAGSGS